MSKRSLKQRCQDCSQASTPNVKQTHPMEVEFGSDFVGDKKRAADAVATRVKNTAESYGFCAKD